MDRNQFDTEARVFLKEIPIGEHGVAFDRIDFDACVDDRKIRARARRDDESKP